MTRKEFMKTGFAGLIAGFFVFFTGRCNSPAGPEAPENNSGASKTFTSNSASGHSHSLTIQRSQVTNPPSGGISGNTTNNSGHSHSFTITQQQLQAINNGQSVTITDSSVSGHTHQYAITKWF